MRAVFSASLDLVSQVVSSGAATGKVFMIFFSLPRWPPDVGALGALRWRLGASSATFGVLQLSGDAFVLCVHSSATFECGNASWTL